MCRKNKYIDLKSCLVTDWSDFILKFHFKNTVAEPQLALLDDTLQRDILTNSTSFLSLLMESIFILR